MRKYSDKFLRIAFHRFYRLLYGFSRKNFPLAGVGIFLPLQLNHDFKQRMRSGRYRQHDAGIIGSLSQRTSRDCVLTAHPYTEQRNANPTERIALGLDTQAKYLKSSDAH